MSDESIHAALKAHIQPNPAWLAKRVEPIVEPGLEIIDPHHHVWDMSGNRYLLDELLADFNSGHHIIASVHVQCHSMHRADGPTEMRCVGETEFVNGVAAMSASGAYGPTKVCAGIIGTADLLLGSRVEQVLQAHINAGGGRFRGIRPSVAWHESAQVRALDIPPHILMHKDARKAIACIERFGLSLDLWCFFTQLDEVLDVARNFPGLCIIVNHTGGPVGIGPYQGQQELVFSQWRRNITALAGCPNVVIKIGGLAMRYGGYRFNELAEPPSSDFLVQKWNDYVHAAIDIFGPQRSMFESNFPVDRGMCNYHVLWNAFKKMSRRYTPSERRCLLSETAANIYRIEI